MAIYEPIRDGFSEFNRMLQDAQTWDERHEAVQQQKNMDNLKLQNGIEQQMFNNKMALASHDLATNRDDRAAEQLDFNIMDSNRKFELNEEATRLGMQSTEEGIKNSKLDRMKKVQDLQEYQMQEAQRPVLMAQAAEQVFNYDPIGDREQAGADAMSRLSQNKSALKMVDSWNQPKKGYLKAEQNKIKGEINRIASSLTSTAQVSALQDQADKAMSLSVQFTNNGDVDTANKLVQKAQMLEDRAAAIVTDHAKDFTKNEKSRVAQQKMANDAFKFGHNQLRKDLSPASDVLDTFPDQKAGITYVEGLYRRLADLPQVDAEGTPIPGTDNAPRNEKEAGALKELALTTFRENHNAIYREYLAAKGNPTRLAEWEEKALDIFGYLPMKPFVRQIWRGKAKAGK